MDAKKSNDVSDAVKPHESPAPRKRFRIERLEERIAPKKGGKGTNNSCYGSSNTISSNAPY